MQRETTAVDEWSIAADDYRIEKSGDLSNITIYLENPRFRTQPDRAVQGLHPL